MYRSSRRASMSHRRGRLYSAESLEPRHLLAADVIINEFMAANQQTIKDGFGASSDWIELRNVGDVETDLSGHYLTDDPDNLNKWSFPTDTKIAAAGLLLVYASGFDAVDPDGAVHTNFRLTSGGDYIALVNEQFEVISEFGTDGEDYPDQFADISFGFQTGGDGLVGFLTTPTPGAANAEVVANAGPWISRVVDRPGAIMADEPLVVTAEVTPREVDIANVSLTYRVMYGEEASLAMRDDGLQGDSVAGDGEYAAVIPAGAAAPGEMIRWYVSATDSAQSSSRAPAFLDQQDSDQSPEYFGTVVADPEVNSQVPILQWFMEPGTERRADSVRGTRASVFYGDQFYDNVFVRLRGGSSANQLKKSYKFDFNTANGFRFHPDAGRVREINLNTTYSNKDYIRQALAFETYDAAGLPASEAFPVRVDRNGEFFSVAIIIEQPDADFLAREGLDDEGALYKMFNTFVPGNVEKKTREYENNDDLNDFVRQVNNLEGEELRNYLFDTINVPAVLNYLAATVVIQNNDQMAKNYFLYRDTNGTGEWMFMPWDLDLVFGLHFMTNDSILDDVIWADKDNITTFAGVTISPSHPFVGEQEHPGNRSWNRLIDALHSVPEFREMHLRRLRTLMDDLLQAPDTPAAELRFEARLDEFARLLGPDVALDYARWADPWRWGADESFETALQRLKDEYFALRRSHLYSTHGVDNLEPGEINVLVPEFTAANYFVPSDNSLGTTWTELGFDDSTWETGETGIGFENNPRNFTDLIRTRVKPAEVAPDSTSVFMRIPFTIDDPDAIKNLTLRMKYDDGFVAFLNGEEVARAGLRTDGPQNFDSRGASRRNNLAVEFEDVLISRHIDKLRQGENVLAIHVMNSSASNSDLLVVPELIDGLVPNTDIVGIPYAQPDDVVLEFGSTIEFNPTSGDQDEEYFTIVNPNDIAVDISGWRVEGSASTTFAEGTIVRAGNSLYVSPNVSAFRAREMSPKGGEGLIVQGYDGHLANSGDTLRLLDDSGRVVSSIEYTGGITSPQENLRITEVNYNPHDALTEFGELDTDNDSFEFVEIANVGATTVDLSGVQLVEVTIDNDTQGVTFEFAEGQLQPDERVLVVKSQSAFGSRYGSNLPIAGQYEGKLSNGGETLTMVNAENDVIQQFRYNDGGSWPAPADGGGPSIEVVDSAGDFNLPQNWRWTRQLGGTPGVAGSSESPDIVINEILTRTIAPAVDQIELLNVSSTAVDIAGWYLTDGNNLTKFRVPGESIVIEPGEYRVFDERQLEFGFKGDDSDDARLIRPDDVGKPIEYVDFVEFPAADTGVSFGRWPNGQGNLQPMATTTFGQANLGSGDVNGDGAVDASDIDLLCQSIRDGNALPNGDLNGDEVFDRQDVTFLVEDVLGTSAGDANLDGVFDSGDLVQVFRGGHYEDDSTGNSTWTTGDWDCNGEFDTSDLVEAFRVGKYVAAAVPSLLTTELKSAIQASHVHQLPGEAIDDGARLVAQIDDMHREALELRLMAVDSMFANERREWNRDELSDDGSRSEDSALGILSPTFGREGL